MLEGLAQSRDSSLGRSQPLDGKIFWNPNGYEWTGIFKNTVIVD